ncbi:hypothetical protein FE257_010081 [Aspergillus nanangensis]|uniref:Enoyl reductase (ER) domain-containing protein n=1 Tax=Aspergillus nanangensis TaxID=2582783 RepID=A0AAD4GTJ7_ASPNN|nr:hypothetical protein FE257_010081 [Aspergillus nanangensis]
MGSIAVHELPLSQRALKVESLGQLTLQGNIHPLPQLEPNEVLVRVVCVALNPYDAKSVDMSPSPGATIGIDFAGEIIAHGKKASPSSLPLGSRVCSGIFGNNPDRPTNGAFAEYVAVLESLVMRIPDTMSFQQAAAMPSGLLTSGLALYHYMGLSLEPPPKNERIYVLVYGAGTATATIAVQVLRQSGFTPITTSSAQHFERLKELGSEAAFDYRSPTCGQDIREYTQGQLAFALDCITTTASMTICYEAIGPQGGQYIALDPFPLHTHTRRSIRPEWILMPTIFGSPIPWEAPYNFLARPTDVEFAKRWIKHAEKLLLQGLVKSHPYQEESGGLQGVITGIDAVRKGHVVGYKLVYSV